jgi:hypothetical protein
VDALEGVDSAATGAALVAVATAETVAALEVDSAETEVASVDTAAGTVAETVALDSVAEIAVDIAVGTVVDTVVDTATDIVADIAADAATVTTVVVVSGGAMVLGPATGIVRGEAGTVRGTAPVPFPMAGMMRGTPVLALGTATARFPWDGMSRGKAVIVPGTDPVQFPMAGMTPGITAQTTVQDTHTGMDLGPLDFLDLTMDTREFSSNRSWFPCRPSGTHHRQPCLQMAPAAPPAAQIHATRECAAHWSKVDRQPVLEMPL